MNPICIVHDGDERATADAHLIAAAPDLLEACRKLLDITQAKGGAFALLHQSECAEAESAIAKAEGR
jgi:urease accessory protein UreF